MSTNAVQRILAINCPKCKAAATTLCIETYHNAAGIQQRHTAKFCADRIFAAQTKDERLMDTVWAVSNFIKENPIK